MIEISGSIHLHQLGRRSPGGQRIVLDGVFKLLLDAEVLEMIRYDSVGFG